MPNSRQHQAPKHRTIAMVPCFSLAYVLNWGFLDEVAPRNVSVHASRRGAILEAVRIFSKLGLGTSEEIAELRQALGSGTAIGFECVNLWFSLHWASVSR